MSGEQHPPIQIVDERDRPLRGGSMDEVQLNGLWHRIVGVAVHDPESDEFLLQKIAPNPYYNGGMWNLTSTGHVDQGESYPVAGRRELWEEMGIVARKLTEHDRYKTEKTAVRMGNDRIYRRHYRIFVSRLTKGTFDIVPNPNEVEDTTWASRNDLIAMANSETPIMTDTLTRFAKRL